MSNIQIDAAVLEAIATHLRKFGFSQPAMIADKIDAILRDHAAREQDVRDIGGNTKVCDKCMRLHKPDQTECFVADTDALLPRPIHQHDFKGVVGMCSCGLSIYDYDKPADTPTQSGECACGHEHFPNGGICRDEHCPCVIYRDRARGGR